MAEPREYQGLGRDRLVQRCEQLKDDVERLECHVDYLYEHVMGTKRAELVRRLMRAEQLRRGAEAQCIRAIWLRASAQGES